MATKFGKLPCEILDEDRQLSSLARYLLNKVVTVFGVTIENALAERENVGSEEKPDWRAKYELVQLLDPAFRLPRPEDRKGKRKKVGEQVKALFGMGKPPKRKSQPVLSPLMTKWYERKGLQ